MQRFLDTKRMSGIVMASLMSFLLVALFTHAATTISTNISTDGTLTINGNTTLGNATATDIIILNAVFTSGLQASSTLQVTGVFTAFGNVTLGDGAADAITLTGNASTTNSFTVGNNLYVTGIASTTGALIVGGDSTNGTIAGMIFGTCNLTQKSINASSTAGTSCVSATGIRGSEKVFVSATSSLATHLTGGWGGFTITAASSTAVNTIGVEISNLTGANNTPAGTLNFWAVR
ncbi:MAG: hypothetical protein AAB378_00595 [Patescibacteria group bacterium]